MKRTDWVRWLFVSGFLASSEIGLGSSTSHSHEPPAEGTAQQVLEQALQILGGRAHLQAIASLTIKAKGSENRAAEIQGHRPAAPTRGAHEETLAIFPSAGKLALDHRTDRHDGSVRHRRWLFAGNDRTVADFIIQGVFPRRNVSTETERTRLARRVPHLLLLEAAQQLAGLTVHANAAVYAGRQHQVLGWTPTNEKTTFRLFFDARTHLLSKCEYTQDYPGLGDTVLEYTYTNWRAHPQLGWFPASQAIKIGGKTFRRVDNLEVTVNASNAEEIFQSPELKRPPAAEPFRVPESFNVAEAERGRVMTVAPGVYVTLVGSFTVMFVEFKDFVLAVEAPANVPNTDYLPADTQPGSTTLSESYIRKIKETVPNKPIRYLTVTHFHNDHAGGTRAFLAEGATIVTTPGDKRLYERMAAASYQAVPDRFSQARRPVRIETFARKRVITDGVRTVELLNTGVNPHTAESVVVYLPAEKILYQGDLFYFDLGGAFPPKDRLIVMRPFARWLMKNQLAPEQLYQTHEVGFATLKHVRQMLESQ
jgi:glyoxylase-like metal-dependent hydrolase (beta-lactamase superfamily II)